MIENRSLKDFFLITLEAKHDGTKCVMIDSFSMVYKDVESRWDERLMKDLTDDELTLDTFDLAAAVERLGLETAAV